MLEIVVIAVVFGFALGALHLAHRRVLDAVLAGHEKERGQWHQERAELLNRIKPETAQPLPGVTAVPPPAVGWDDDEGFWQAREERAKAA